jgi:hypothetical protein
VSEKKNSKFASILIGPALVIGGIMALWQNEGRFDYYKAAKDTIVINSPSEHAGEPVSYTSDLDTTIPIGGEYVERFVSYHMVRRSAEIYSWDKSTDSDGHTTWRQGWYSSLENNSRNSGFSQQLSSRRFYPPRYSLGDMEISPKHIHFVDEDVSIPMDSVALTGKGRSLGLSQQSGYLYLDKGRSDDFGDERVSYQGIPNAPLASYFGVVSDSKGVGRQFEVNTGIISQLIANDGILHHLVNGDREQSLDKIKADFSRVVWYTRFGGSAAIIFGIYTFLSSFMSLLYRIPLLGNLVESGVILVSLVVGLPIALFVILAGLIIHNPLSVALPLAIIVGGIVYVIRRSRATTKNAQRILSDRLSTPHTARPVSASNPSPVQDNAARLAASAGFATQQSTTDDRPVTPAQETALTGDGDESGLDVIEKTFVHLAIMALAEGGLDKKENKMLVTWGKENGVTKERMKELYVKAKKGDVAHHPANREDLELLACMALIDGDLSKREWKILVTIASKMGLSALDVRNIISDIASGQLAPA